MAPQYQNNCFCTRINHGEVRVALRKMGRNKAVGPDQIPIEAWRCLGDDGVRWLTNLFNMTFRSAKMPMEWRLSEVILIYKNKGDAQTCSNYRGIKLLSHTMKLWERVIETRLRRETKVSENQFGFMPGRSSMEDELNRRLEQWRNALEQNGLRISRLKSEYLRCGYGRIEDHNDTVDIRIGDQVLHPHDSFRYLGSMLHKSGRIDEDVSHRIRVGWLKWRAAKGVLKNLEVGNIVNKMREGRLRWFGHVRRRPPTAPVRRVEALTVGGVRRRVTSLNGFHGSAGRRSLGSSLSAL
ncbi:uncharacterized protein [Rutidosis leptorrhynchoides]|uniref:uncharacterized protein n=1 Tax=Rutidosis leptorrhynchoides TaxID=125765 RepID=UPI003A9A4B12